jgi:hypothetical protein
MMKKKITKERDWMLPIVSGGSDGINIWSLASIYFHKFRK